LTNPALVDRTAPVLAHHGIDIHASLEAVWARHIGVNAWPRWKPEITSARLDAQFEPGASFDWESYGLPVTSLVYVVEYTSRILWGGTAGGITGVHYWLFTPMDGGVHVETNESSAGEAVQENLAGMQTQLNGSLVAWLGRLTTASANVRID